MFVGISERFIEDMLQRDYLETARILQAFIVMSRHPLQVRSFNVQRPQHKNDMSQLFPPYGS